MPNNSSLCKLSSLDFQDYTPFHMLFLVSHAIPNLVFEQREKERERERERASERASPIVSPIICEEIGQKGGHILHTRFPDPCLKKTSKARESVPPLHQHIKSRSTLFSTTCETLAVALVADSYEAWHNTPSILLHVAVAWFVKHLKLPSKLI